ncbi:MAG: PLP-dependent aminotransferase family protein [Proteobacteria bacterium]|nr:PLP-dependent aminotransferase family protein [Pseudomonadota bacterium]MBU1594361.1 PLP-dependent aminotransferase family protein [Pseudomonadota bacterium]
MTIWMPQLAGDRPIYLGLAEAILADVESGALKPGDRLPTHRDLADALGVTVGTVTRGYAEAARRGLVRGEVGRGTVVALAGEAAASWWGKDGDESGRIDLGLVMGMHGLDPDLGSALLELAGRGDVQELLRYQPSRGMVRHREAGSAWLRRFGLAVAPERVLVTSGGQHALLVLFSVLFRPGDRIAAACLNYPGLMTAASLLGLKLVPLECDEQGILPGALSEACAREAIRGLYLMPGVHNPTTACAGPERLARLADIARARGLLVLEDGAYTLTAEDPADTLAGLAPERTFFVASVSKMLAGGLRVAFVASPQEYVERLSQGITGTTWMAAPLCVEIACTWIADGTAEAVFARKRAEAVRRSELARQVLDGQRFRSRRSGYFLWLELPEPWRGTDFERAALERGVIVVAGESFALGQTAAPMAVRVSLSAARSREELRRGLEILLELMLQQPRPGRSIA